ncbi:MAG TPA: reverse transcriptase family protein [Terracidiphilus sp.]|nr:reverse transcriptase family protein [Terracidiphilus sp.]
MTRWNTPLPHKHANPTLLNVLAHSILAGEASVVAITGRMYKTLGREWRWIQPMAQRYVEQFALGTRPRLHKVVEFLAKDKGLRGAQARSGNTLQIRDRFAVQQQMLPAPKAGHWKVPVIESKGELATWLGLSASELEWFADLKRLLARSNEQKIQHYFYRVLAKDSGSARLIEAPKPRLKKVQRKILTDIVERIPPHPAAHGFVIGRSIKTFAAPHAGRRVVLRMDLREFFPSLRSGRVQALFRTAGYPERVADLLGGLCTNAVPRGLWNCSTTAVDPLALHEMRQRYSWPHLPQGAPTSPALANLCAHRLDRRLNGLARAAGAIYTRYADDLAFSGDGGFEKHVERFAAHVAAIVLEEGFEVHHRKTRIMRQGVRQYLAGVVTNEHVNVVRADFDRLKATLTNCVVHGPESQNREQHPAFRQHLCGRVAFAEMLNPQKGARLRKIFARIQWAGEE